MRILIDGLDLTGKTTLARELTQHLTDVGVPVISSRGFLAPHNPLALLFRHVSPAKHADSQALHVGYLATAVLDRLLGASWWAERSAVVVHESYIDRSIAYGAAHDWSSSHLATRVPALFARFDLAVVVHAPIEVRRARLAQRVGADAIDHRSVADDAFVAAFRAAMRRVAARHRQVVEVDTTDLAPQQIAASVAMTVLTHLEGAAT